MLKKVAMVFGVVFVLIGVLGFVPPLTPNGYLLGIFMVDPLHNVIHLASGVAALAASSSASYSRLYFRIFGVVYALVTVLGFIMSPILGLLAVNPADNFLHLAIAAVTLYFGFAYKGSERELATA